MAMDPDEARGFLGLDATATLEQIDARVRDLVTDGHPDRGGDADIGRLLEARDVLRQLHGPKGTHLATREHEALADITRELAGFRGQLQELQRTTRELHDVAATSGASIVRRSRAGDQIVTLYRSHHREFVWRASASAAVLAAGTAFAAVAVPGPSAIKAGVSTVLGILLLVQPLNVLRDRAYLRRIERALDETRRALDDPSTYLALLCEITARDRALIERWATSDYQPSDVLEAQGRMSPWTKAELSEVVRGWLQDEAAIRRQPLAVAIRNLLISLVTGPLHRHPDESVPIAGFAAAVGTADFVDLLIEIGTADGLLAAEDDRQGVRGRFYSPTVSLDSVRPPPEASWDGLPF